MTKSKCCGAEVRIGVGSVMNYYVCTKCNNVCVDVVDDTEPPLVMRDNKVIILPRTIKIGGFDYQIDLSPEAQVILTERNSFGLCQNVQRKILLDNRLCGQSFTWDFLHELVHAIGYVYNEHGQAGSEEAAMTLSNGLLQVFEQLGIRFSVEK